MNSNFTETYEILGKLGEGQGGTVFKAYHRHLRKDVVLKKIRNDMKNVLNKRSEVDILKNLKHPYLPQVLDFLEIDGDIYTVMEFIPGKSFGQYLRAGQRFDQKQVVEWGIQLCSVLTYIHSQKPPIIHKDIKPDNIMVTGQGNLCLIDFNVSEMLGGHGQSTNAFTPGYAAPEQIAAARYNQKERDPRKWRRVDARADVYSAGATLYHLLTGVKPDLNASKVKNIRSFKLKISKGLAEIITRCMCPNPAERFQSAAEVQQALEELNGTAKKKKFFTKGKAVGLSIVGIFVLIGVLIFQVYVHMGEVKTKKYREYVRMEKECLEDMEYEELENYFQQAIALNPVGADAHYYMAKSLYDQQEYKEAADFIQGDMLENSNLVIEEEGRGSVYYLLASSYDKLGKYGNACKYFEMAVANDKENPDYYRDYAIALVRSGDIKKAKEILEDAKDLGITTDNMEYVEGEIAFADEDYKKAEDIFSSCMKKSEDSYIKMRSCVMLCKILDADEKNEKNCEKKLQMLEDMKKELPVENQLPILESQIDCYMEMYGYTEKESYQDDAVEVLETIREQGLGNYTTADNLVILYQQKKELDKAKDLLEEMEENYGSYYNTYKRFAFLEIAIQEEKDVEKRDYSDFESYYDEACKLYTKEESNNETDPEMKRLEDLYKQVKMRGWLDD